MTAREYGVDLADVPATGPKGRILKEDVQAYVKNMLHKAKQAPAEGASGGAGIPPIPAVDFSKFGEVEEVAMSRMMQIGGANLHRSRSEARRVGKEGVSTCSFRWSPRPSEKKQNL